MTEPISLRLSGHSRPFLLSQEAHDALQDYLARSRHGLRAEPDADEILRDLEAAIGDRLATVAADPVDVNQMSGVLVAVGPVTPTVELAPEYTGPSRGRFWCRIDQGRWFAGVCGGLAAYTGFRLDWIRSLAVILTVFTGGALAVVYLVLAIVLPSVASIEEYQRLRDSPPAQD